MATLITPGERVEGLGGYVVKPVIKKFKAQSQSEGAGFVIRRPIGRTLSDEEADPFLLLDELGPVSYAKGEFPGAPWHPHRGFDTVMYMLQGEGKHQDSMGNSGILRAGDVQWMTAGSGIEHDEGRDHPGGILHGFQMWINLPSHLKMSDPSYQDIPSDDIPVVEIKDGLKAKILAGTCHRINAIIQTQVECQYLDFQITLEGKSSDGLEYTHIVPEKMTTGIVFVYHGTGLFGANDIECTDGDTILLGPGDSLRFKCVTKLDNRNKKLYTEDLRFLFLAGKPLKEPIERHGPFVMNTREELLIAFKEYQQGTFIKKKGIMLKKTPTVLGEKDEGEERTGEETNSDDNGNNNNNIKKKKSDDSGSNKE